jgi:hypothetical protein
MANITHTSTGASNSPKLLSVTANISTIPQSGNLWLDFQIDSQLTAVAGEITSWIDSINSNEITPYSSSYKPTADATKQLLGISTPKFGGTYPNYKRLVSNVVLNPPRSAASITNCILVYPGTHSGVVFTVENYLYTSPHRSGAIFLNASNNTITVSVGSGAGTSYVYPGSFILGSWNVIMATVDYIADTVTVYINGVSAGVHNLSRDQGYSQITDIKMNANNPFDGNIAAALSWYNAAFTPDEYIETYNYLALKYGLT